MADQQARRMDPQFGEKLHLFQCASASLAVRKDRRAGGKMGRGNGLGNFSGVVVDHVVIRGELDQSRPDIGSLHDFRAGVNCHAYVDFLDHPLGQGLDRLVIAEMIGSIKSAAMKARAGD